MDNDWAVSGIQCRESSGKDLQKRSDRQQGLTKLPLKHAIYIKQDAQRRAR